MIDGRLAGEFNNGDDGWELYKEVSCLVQDHAPTHWDEYKERFSKLPSKEAIQKEMARVDFVQLARQIIQNNKQ